MREARQSRIKGERISHRPIHRRVQSSTSSSRRGRASKAIRRASGEAQQGAGPGQGHGKGQGHGQGQGPGQEQGKDHEKADKHDQGDK